MSKTPGLRLGGVRMKQAPSSLSVLTWSFGVIAQQSRELAKAKIWAVRSRGDFRTSDCREEPERSWEGRRKGL